MNAKDALIATLADLNKKATNAAKRNKPTMWAYFLDMHTGLVEWFGTTANGTPDAIAASAARLSDNAVALCPRQLPIRQAARLWALGVYARRIAAAGGIKRRVSLAWLKQREEARLETVNWLREARPGDYAPGDSVGVIL